jgi:uncharacterized damage-inducible protein DinB
MTQEPVRTALSRGPCPSFPLLASRYLEEYLEKIRRGLELLDEEGVWWRPAAGTNSAGNLVLHLCGNLSLWIGEGVGGEPYDRDRAGELAADRSHTKEELLERLAVVVDRCRRILTALDGEPLDRRIDVQGYEVDVLGAVFHAVEHMSYHTGQILWLAKARAGEGHGLELYPQHAGE